MKIHQSSIAPGARSDAAYSAFLQSIFLLAVSDLVKRGILCDSEIVNEFCVGRSPLLISYLRILFDYYTATINSRLQEQMYTWLCLF